MQDLAYDNLTEVRPLQGFKGILVLFSDYKELVYSQSKEELNRKSLTKITVTFVETPKIQDIKKNKSIKNYIRNEDEFIFYIAGSMNDFVQFLSKYKIEQLYSDTSDLNETLLEYF